MFKFSPSPQLFIHSSAENLYKFVLPLFSNEIKNTLEYDLSITINRNIDNSTALSDMWGLI